jgi:hypothetical protein
MNQHPTDTPDQMAQRLAERARALHALSCLMQLLVVARSHVDAYLRSRNACSEALEATRELWRRRGWHDDDGDEC